MSGAAAQSDRKARHQLYGSAWRKAREGFLRNHPLCVMCAQVGRTVLASVVDHIRPHQGDRALFWDRDNWQPLCKPCHDRHKQRIDRGGRDPGCDQRGVPVDPGHHWNTAEVARQGGGSETSKATGCGPAWSLFSQSREMDRGDTGLTQRPKRTGGR
jgi:hypothetical protein